MISCDAAALIDAHNQAYESRDSVALSEMYAPEAQIFGRRGPADFEGREAIREEYSSFFAAAGDFSVEVTNRIVLENTVADEELVRVSGFEPVELLAVYTLADCKIARIDLYPEQEPVR